MTQDQADTPWLDAPASPSIAKVVDVVCEVKSIGGPGVRLLVEVRPQTIEVIDFYLDELPA